MAVNPVSGKENPSWHNVGPSRPSLTRQGKTEEVKFATSPQGDVYWIAGDRGRWFAVWLRPEGGTELLAREIQIFETAYDVITNHYHYDIGKVA